MFFTAKVEYFNDEQIEIETNYSFVCADTFNDAVEQITDYYGEKNIESMFVKAFSPSNLLEFESADEELFERVEKTLAERVIW